jgi:hypothetical protein
MIAIQILCSFSRDRLAVVLLIMLSLIKKGVVWVALSLTMAACLAFIMFLPWLQIVFSAFQASQFQVQFAVMDLPQLRMGKGAVLDARRVVYLAQVLASVFNVPLVILNLGTNFLEEVAVILRLETTLMVMEGVVLALPLSLGASSASMIEHEVSLPAQLVHLTTTLPEIYVALLMIFLTLMVSEDALLVQVF